MFINKKIKTFLFFLLILGLDTTLNSVITDAIVTNEGAFELTINGTKVTQDNATTLPVWEIIDDIKLELKQKIDGIDNLDFYEEITKFLEHSASIEKFLETFIPRLAKELKSDHQFSESKLGLIDDAVNETLDLDDLLILKDLQKEKLLLKKISYVSLNITLMWISDFSKNILDNKANYNPLLKEKIIKYKEILDMITEKINEKIEIIKSEQKTKIKKINPNKVIEFLSGIKFEKVAINPISIQIINILARQQNFVKKYVLEHNLFSSKTNREIATKLSMKNIAIKSFQETFTEEEMKTLIKYSKTGLFKKLTTTINKESKRIALTHIFFNLFQKAKP